MNKLQHTTEVKRDAESLNSMIKQQTIAMADGVLALNDSAEDTVGSGKGRTGPGTLGANESARAKLI